MVILYNWGAVATPPRTRTRIKIPAVDSLTAVAAFDIAAYHYVAF